MSFILDALKKVERQKGAAGAIRVAEGVLGKRSSGGGRARELLVMGGIAVLSAGATAGALWFLMEKPPVEAIATDEPAVAPESNLPQRLEQPLPPPPAAVPEATATEPSAKREELSGETRREGSLARGAETLEIEVGANRESAEVEGPSEPPDLVLQGTSVLRGEPVAVINDQRVFEGDRVQGALVIRIEERTVELEFDGRRFTIRL